MDYRVTPDNDRLIQVRHCRSLFRRVASRSCKPCVKVSPHTAQVFQKGGGIRHPQRKRLGDLAAAKLSFANSAGWSSLAARRAHNPKVVGSNPAVHDCAAVSRQLSAVLDIEDPLNGAYLLEVSSPGLERPLVKPNHFKRFVGNKARIVMATHIFGRRRFTGQMVEAGDQAVVLEVDGESYDLPYSDMESAQLQPI